MPIDASLTFLRKSSIIQTYSRKHVRKQVLYPILLVVILRPSIVRFRLPLTPPQGSEMPPKSVQYREFGTKEATVDILKLNRSASKWRKTDLDLLGVDYDYTRCEDIHIPNTGIPAELVESNSVLSQADI
jgi:hypothetical protein